MTGWLCACLFSQLAIFNVDTLHVASCNQPEHSGWFLFALFAIAKHILFDRILPSSISNYIFKWLYNTPLMHLLTWLMQTRSHAMHAARWFWINDFRIGKYRTAYAEYHDDSNLIFVNKFLQNNRRIKHSISDTHTHTNANTCTHKTSTKTCAYADGIAVFEMVCYLVEQANAIESHLKIISTQHALSTHSLRAQCIIKPF